MEGHVPAINIEHYLKPLRPKRTVRARQYENYIHQNIVENYVNNNTKCFQTIPAKCESFRNSYFVRTVLDWNKLNDSVVNSKSVDCFKTALVKSD